MAAASAIGIEDTHGLALARLRLAEPRRRRASPWKALGAAFLAATAAGALCVAVFIGASFAPQPPRTLAVAPPAPQPVGAVEHR